MSPLQSLLLSPRVLLGCGIVTLIILILSQGHSQGTGSQGVAWVKGTSHNHENSSPLQKKISEVYNSTLGFEKIFALSLPERLDHRDSLTLTSVLTSFHLDFVDGIKYQDILNKTLPAHDGIAYNGARGAWRGHINAMREIVDKGYGSALIFEDDADWDIRLKDQLRDFAIASNGLLSQYPGTHEPHFANRAGDYIDYSDLATWLRVQDSRIQTPHSPYGDGWDVLWLGNCGMRMAARADEWQTLPIVRQADPTVLPVEHYAHWDWADPHPYDNYPNRTRLYLSQPSDGVCSIAYAVSQQGARRILLELGIERADKAMDLMLQDFCQGGWDGGLPHPCWGVLPPLFEQYRPAGLESKDSDIVTGSDEVRFRVDGFTANIQQSVRMNARKLLAEPVGEVVDQYQYDQGT
ncbi:hypothetical protein LTR70_001490 [Exophiala xenobiotica]|uniref:Glycosyltransferase family 25 protein n=1 Tax=Lithohypha guttulata TaxID=1690604 RepID=A0ABR0KGZ8_9EURO|nr:hypothetical protein LTR24_002780 [Lithohypha guttulata]KAK5327867.1 hypothetical protein LTR70_001490 [Exophiala xenobiotica]